MPEQEFRDWLESHDYKPMINVSLALLAVVSIDRLLTLIAVFAANRLVVAIDPLPCPGVLRICGFKPNQL